MNIEQIYAEIAEKCATLDPIDNSLKFVLDGQPIVIDGTGDSNVVSREDSEAECTITLSLKTYGKLLRKELNPMMATMTGKVKIKGDLAVAAKLKQLF